jgi:hypothetical protein
MSLLTRLRKTNRAGAGEPSIQNPKFKTANPKSKISRQPRRLRGYPLSLSRWEGKKGFAILPP